MLIKNSILYNFLTFKIKQYQSYPMISMQVELEKVSRGNNSKAKLQELSSFFMTHPLNVMHAPVKFHEYIPYDLGVMARTRLTIWNLVKGK